LIRARISLASTVQMDRLPQVKYTRVDLGRAKSSTLKEHCKDTLGSPNQKCECGASLNALELTREKEFHMGDNLLPKHCPNRKTLASRKYRCVKLREGQN